LQNSKRIIFERHIDDLIYARGSRAIVGDPGSQKFLDFIRGQFLKHAGTSWGVNWAKYFSDQWAAAHGGDAEKLFLEFSSLTPEADGERPAAPHESESGDGVDAEPDPVPDV
jgi:hypothetical protein